MDPVIATGIFALGGVALSAVSAWVGAWLQRKWGREDAAELHQRERERDRDERLFNHKIQAYMELLNASNAFTTKLFDWDTRSLNLPLPPLGDLVPVLEAHDRVRIFGSKEVGECARTLAGALEDLVTADPTPAADALLTKALNADHALTNAMRVDLGSGELLGPDERRLAD